MFAFGVDNTFWFYPLVDQESPETILTTQTTNVYVFSSRPSRDQAIAGTGAIATIAGAGLTWDAATQGFSFTIPAIDDPNPTSENPSEQYWLGINFRLQDAKQIQTVLHALDLQRVAVQHKTVLVSTDDLKGYFAQVEAYSTEEQRVGHIATALIAVQDFLKSKGYQWAKVYRPDHLHRAVCLKALSLIMLAQSNANNDRFYIKYLEYKEMYKECISSLQLEYDADGDGAPESTVETSSNFVLLER